MKAFEKLEKYFGQKPKTHLTMGVEMECYLWDCFEQRLLNKEEVINKVLDELPQVITRDYYTYQLEIRTTPHNTVEELMKEFKRNMELSEKVCQKYDLRIIPLSWMGGNEMFNGMHFHFRNGSKNNFEQTMFNIYPFILALTDVFKFSPFTQNVLSRRFQSSPHFSLPNMYEMVKSCRFSDVCMNMNKENNRHRLKSVNTIEIRTFDLPFNLKHMNNLAGLLFNIMAFIKTHEKITGHDTLSKLTEQLSSTRTSIKNNPVGYNHLFRLYNVEIYRWLCDNFNQEVLPLPFDLTHTIDLSYYVNSVTSRTFLEGGEE